MPHREPERWLPHEGETPPDTLARLCREVRHLTEADRVVVWLYEAATRTLRPTQADPLDQTPAAARRWRIAVDDYAAAIEVIDERRRVRVDKPKDDPRVPGDIAEALDISSYDLLPLVAGRIAGLLAVEPAGRADERLDAVLPYIAAAASQTVAWHESEHRRQRTDLLLSIIEEAAPGDSLDLILSSICERLTQELHARRASVFLVEDGRFVPAMSRYADGVLRESEWETFVAADEPFPFGEEVLRTGEPLVVEDTKPFGDWWAERFGVASALGVPIGAPPDSVGILVLDSPRPQRFSDEHVRLAAAVGSHVAGLIDRARAAEVRDSHLAVEAAVRQLLERASGATSVNEAVDVLTHVAHESLGTDHAVAYLQGEFGGVDVIAVDVADEYVSIIRDQIVGDGHWLGYRVTSPEVVAVNDALNSDVISPEIAERLGLKSFIALPVLGTRGPIGVVTCAMTSSHRRWSETDRRIAEQLTREGSLVVENAALREAERSRLAEMSHRAFHDGLTGLPNRTLLLDRIDHALARAERRPEAVAVLFVDLDNFKRINDTLGHEAGDRILVEVARRLEDSIRPADTVARLAGDEFVVVLEDIAGPSEATRIAERINDELSRAFIHGGRQVHIGASVGISIGVSDVRGAEELVRRADRAMYRVKRDGGATYRIYDAAIDDTHIGEMSMEVELHGALDRQELKLRYHPIVELETERIRGVEALVRWEHPRLGLIDADQFVTIADEAGLLPDIGAWVLRRAHRQVAAWVRDGHDLDLHVNVSKRQLRHESLIETLEEVVDRGSIKPAKLVIEVSEAGVTGDLEEATARLNEIRGLGIRIALDDFGSAQSSLRYLQKLPVDILKVDRAFIDGVATEVGDAALVRAIVDVARTFGFEVIAEGIETMRQRDELVKIGCGYGQGFLFERPATSDRVAYLLDRQRQAGSAPVSSPGSAGTDVPGSA